MFRFKLPAIICLAFVASLLLIEAQGQPAKKGDEAPHPSQDARRLLKDINDILNKLAVGQATPKEVIRNMQVLEALAGETASMHHRLAIVLHTHPDPAVRRQAAITLEAIGHHPRNAPVVVSHLIKGLDDRDEEVRATCFVMLGQMEHHAMPAIPRAKEAMNHKDARIRRAAILTLGSLAIHDKYLIPVLVAALDDPDTGYEKFGKGNGSVSMSAMTQLQRLGPLAKESLAKLKNIATGKQGDDYYRQVALNAIIAISPDDPLPLSIAIEWLRRKDSPEVVIKGARFVTGLARRGKPAVPDLIAILKGAPYPDKLVEQRVKIATLEALGSLGPAAKDALPAMRAMLVTGDSTLRLHAAGAILAVQSK